MRGTTFGAGLIACLALYASLGVETAWAQACGQVLTQSTRLRADIVGCTGNGLEIGADRVTLDCAGRTISGVDGTDTGVLINNQEKVTIRNCRITGFETGIYLIEASENSIRANRIFDNSDAGVFLASSDDNSIARNAIYNNANEGIGLDDQMNNRNGSDRNDISFNYVNKNSIVGVDLNDNSKNNKVSRNNIFENGRGLDMDFANENRINNNKITSNEGSGIALSFRSGGNKIFRNFVSRNARSVAASGMEICNDCEGNSFQYNIVTRTRFNLGATNIRNGVGILLRGNNSEVRGNRGSRNKASGLLVIGTGNTVSANAFNRNDGNGICVVAGNTDRRLNRGIRNAGKNVTFNASQCPVP